MRNPFAPTFGATPPVLAGRDELLSMMDEAFEVGPTHPAYTSILVGIRGAGKTAALNAIEDIAAEKGWRVIAVDSASGPVTDQVIRAAVRLLAEADPPTAARISAVTIAGQKVEFTPGEGQPKPETLREVLTLLADHMEENEVGLLVTVDELQGVPIEEMRAFGGVLQHVCRREQRPVAFVGAGLPELEDSLLADNQATFLQRCERFDLGSIPDVEVAKALAQPVAEAGGSITDDGLELAVREAAGYAFMIQLIGFHMWRRGTNPPHFTRDDVAQGVAEANRRIGRAVLEPIWRSLSDVDREFCFAMAEDDGPTAVADLQRRLGRDGNYVNAYRARLIKAGMIVAAGYGFVDFAHHATRRWVREVAARARTQP